MPAKTIIKDYRATIRVEIKIHALSMERAKATATSFAHVLRGEVESVEEKPVINNEP